MMKLQKLLTLSLFILFSNIALAQEWVNTNGPDGGAILEAVSHDGKLFGRTGTNLYVSEDAGINWTLLGGDEFINITPGSLTSTSYGVHFTSSTSKISSIYDGTTIEASAEGFGQFEFPSKITSVVDTLYSVAGTKLYKSIDGAKTWSVANTVGFGDAVFGAGNRVFTASLTAGIKVSNDGGVSFANFGPTLSFELLSSLVEIGDEIVFATNQGVWAKNAAGEWEKTFTNLGSFTNLATIDGSIYGLNGSVTIVDGAIVASADIYASADTGKTWVKVAIESDQKPIYGDHNKVVAVNGKLYATAIQKSNPLVSHDGGVNWTTLGGSGLKNPSIRGIFTIDNDIFVTTNDGAGIGQFGHGVFKSSDGGDAWSKVPIDLPDGHNGSFYTVRKNGSDLYASSYAGLFRSTDNGSTWTVMAGTQDWYISDIHFTDNLWIMAGGDGFSRVWTSSDSGVTWNTHYKGIGAIFEKIHEAENGIVIGSNTTLIASSQDGGTTWHFAHADSGLSVFGGGYFDVASVGETIFSLPINEENIYKSENGGRTWSKTTNLVGLEGVILDRLFSFEGKLYILGTKAVFEGGVLAYPKVLFKSEDGVNFTKVMDVEGVPYGFASPSVAFLGDDLLLGYKGTPVFKSKSGSMGTPNELEKEEVATLFKLNQNYPNPFNPSTNISFTVPEASHVSLTVYNLLGQQVATLIDGRINAGNQSILFNASSLSSGVYIYRLKAGANVQTKRMLLLK